MCLFPRKLLVILVFLYTSYTHTHPQILSILFGAHQQTSGSNAVIFPNYSRFHKITCNARMFKLVKALLHNFGWNHFLWPVFVCLHFTCAHFVRVAIFPLNYVFFDRINLIRCLFQKFKCKIGFFHQQVS